MQHSQTTLEDSVEGDKNDYSVENQTNSLGHLFSTSHLQEKNRAKSGLGLRLKGSLQTQ